MGLEEIQLNKIVLALISSSEFQRLKKITLGGFNVFLSESNPLYRKREATVFEHCLGVYAILTRLDVDYEERIMGLLHDISRPAFGHIIDFVFGDYERQEWHEKIMGDFLRGSEIEKILSNYGLDLEKMIKKFRNGEYRYLDSPIPDICADRLDYSLRHMTYLLKKNLFWVLRDIKKGDTLYFSSKKTALIYSLGYLELSNKYYVGKDSAVFLIVSKILRRALDKGLIQVEDFLRKGEEEIYRLLLKDKELKKVLNLLRYIRVKTSKENFDFVIKTKCRYVDPIVNGVRLSRVDGYFKSKVEAFLGRCGEGIKVRIYPRELVNILSNW